MADPVLTVIERSNQRGGRMFSVMDLITAGTLSPGQAAWLLDRIAVGSSWLVGARPGGAGKTTVMSALLCHLPGNATVRITNPGTDWENSQPGDCVVAYEIGGGPYDAYIWGRDVRRLTRLGVEGVRIVSNLHADTVEEARDQIVRQCGASEAEFQAFALFLPITIQRSDFSVQREIRTVYLAENGAWRPVSREAAEAAASSASLDFLKDCRARGLRTTEEVRAHWLRRSR